MNTPLLFILITASATSYISLSDLFSFTQIIIAAVTVTILITKDRRGD